jgi:zinc protease
MTGVFDRGKRRVWVPTLSVAVVLLAGAALFFAGRGRAAQTDGERLPGRSRPIVVHDWPHPRDFKFKRASFAPPDPGRALVRAKSGVRAYVIADAGDPLVRLTAAVPLGRLYERPGEAGASALLAQLLTQDDPADAGRALSLRLESLGTSLQVEEALDMTRLSFDVLAEDWREGLAVLVDVVRRSRFDEAVIRAYRAGPGYSAVLAGVAGNGFRPKIELERILAGYPLAPPEPGTVVAPDAMRAVASRALAPDQVVLGVGGNVPRDQVEAALNQATEGWQPNPQRATASQFTRLPSRGGSVRTIDVAALEGWIAIGRVIGPVPDAERAPLAVAAEILNTRLNVTTREIRGLSNRTSFELPDTASGAGVLLVRSGGRIEAVAPLVKFSVQELARISAADDSIAAEELERAKGTLTLGKWPSILDGARQASGTYAVETVRNGAPDQLLKWPGIVEAVTVSQVKAVAQKYLAPAEFVTMVAGPLQKIRAARHPRWPVSFDELTTTQVSQR